MGCRCRWCGGLRLGWLWAAWWRLDLDGPGIGVHGMGSGQLDELKKGQEKNECRSERLVRCNPRKSQHDLKIWIRVWVAKESI